MLDLMLGFAIGYVIGWMIVLIYRAAWKWYRSE